MVGRFFITEPLFLPISVLEDCMVLRICPLLDCLLADFIYQSLLSFFLLSLANSVLVLFIFKEPALHFFDFYFLVSISITNYLIFVTSFLLLTLGFIVLFLVPLGVGLDCLFEVFLTS